jgi:long-chain acyl-CoA synthetase
VCEVLYASGQVAEALVGGEADGQRGERIVAYVVLRDGGDLRRLQRFCKTELPRYMQPARIELMSDLPRTTSGKFDLRAAQARASEGREGALEVLAASGEGADGSAQGAAL